MATKKSTKKPAKKAAVSRSSKSGKFVSEDFAKKHPATTQKSKRPKKEAVKVENGKSEVVVTQTDASAAALSQAVDKVLTAERLDGALTTSLIPLDEFRDIAPHAFHAEAVQAAEESNKEFATAIFVPLESMSEAMKPTVLQIARQAWAQVKGANDPDFDSCVPTHRDKFLSHCESILRGNAPQEGDTQLARFEQAVSNKEN